MFIIFTYLMGEIYIWKVFQESFKMTHKFGSSGYIVYSDCVTFFVN